MRPASIYTELANGVRFLSDPQITWWSDRFAHHGLTPRDVCDYLTQGVPGDRDNLVQRVDIKENLASLEITGYDPSGAVFWTSRSLEFADQQLHLDLLNVREDLQSHGHGRTMLRNAYRLARQLRFRRLALIAMEVGSFTWARAGFLPTYQTWNDANCRGRITSYITARRHQFGSALAAKLLEYAQWDDPESIWILADNETKVPLLKRPDVIVPVGVAVLFESEASWRGTIELHDGPIRRKQIDRVRAYLGLSAGE